jgi:hypothetical protein
VNSPWISIVIPVYNGADYLAQAIESALAQTYPRREVLVINDGSTDEGATAAVAARFGKAIRYFEQPNGGVASALNRGIREMQGDFFSWLSHDDLYYPHKLACQVEWLRQHPDGTCLYTDFDVIDAQGHLLRTEILPHIEPAALRTMLVADYPVHGCTTLIPRSCFDTVGLFDERLRTTQDYDFWFRLAARFPLVHLPEVLIQSREHVQQGSRSIPGRYEENDRLYQRMLDELTPAELAAARPDLSLWQTYAWLAERLARHKRFPLPAQHAWKLAQQAAQQAGWRARLALWQRRLADTARHSTPALWLRRAARRAQALLPTASRPG